MDELTDELCLCGHGSREHKQQFDEGLPTKNFPCHAYGCVCGVFEEPDWEQFDAEVDAYMSFQRSIPTDRHSPN